ncbi:MAG: EF-hand domain-containing protein [Verrucomicrobia bacterium]|nr:EF-hand domain-containing protein [Verrucomicrobiota bacterium]
MKKTLISIICLATAGSVLAGPAENFKRADKDKNGFISKEEYLAMRKGYAEKKGGTQDVEKDGKTFARKDADKDGKLTLEEFSASNK